MTQPIDRPRIRLKPKANARGLRNGFPWVYANDIVADRRREMLADPGLCGAWHTEEQQRAIRCQRGHRHLDQALTPDVLRRDHRAIGQLTAEQVAHDGPGRTAPDP